MIDNNTPPPTPEQIAEARENAVNASHPASWVWNEELVSWAAPVAPPADGFPYIWNEDTTSWIPFPDYPRN
jgi:hypothetical protein